MPFGVVSRQIRVECCGSTLADDKFNSATSKPEVLTTQAASKIETQFRKIEMRFRRLHLGSRGRQEE